MWLTPRDQALVKLLDRYSILSSSQVEEFFFKGIARTTIHRRLRQLEKLNYIRRSHGLPNGELIWGLGRRAVKQGYLEFPIRSFNRNTFDHDVAVNYARYVFEKNGLGNNWTSEWEMKCKSSDPKRPDLNANRSIPDGLIITPDGNKVNVVAVEVEMSLKSAKRYAKILLGYRSNSDISLCWYIARDEKILKYILSVNNRLLNKSGKTAIAGTLYQDLKANGLDAKITFFDQKNSVSVRECFKINQTELDKSNAPLQATG